MSDRPEVRQARVVNPMPASPLDPLAALGQIIDIAREVGRERTARARITAYSEIEINRIKSAEDVLKGYFEKIFAERRSNFEGLFARLDTALEQGDGATVNNVLRGIVDIARSSPLADLGDLGKLRAALDDPDQVWDL
jgi:hypothetical protein